MKIKKKKKCLKVNIYVVLIFEQNRLFPFKKVKKCQYFAKKIFFQVQNVKKWPNKTGRVGPTILKLSTQRTQVF